MDTIVKSVYDFNRRVILMPDTLPMQPLSSELRDWFVKALTEEIEEFAQAWEADEFVGQVDAILDLIYFAVGRLQQMGLTEVQTMTCFNAIHQANMTKRRGLQAKRGNVEADAVKPDDWVSPETRIRNILFGELGK